MNTDKINMIKSYMNVIEDAMGNIYDVLSDSKDDIIEELEEWESESKEEKPSIFSIMR